eukprot:15366842-Ditylum_brightwellii.AAC.3
MSPQPRPPQHVQPKVPFNMPGDSNRPFPTFKDGTLQEFWQIEGFAQGCSLLGIFSALVPG